MEENSDARRTLALLWRDRTSAPGRHPRRGRPPRITVDRIIEAAIAVADEEGMEATSMSRVADRLGVATMSLYTHVASKAELVDLMVDIVMCERNLPSPGDHDRPGDWRAQILLYARRTRAAHLRHPWLRQLSAIRQPLGPGTMAQQEYLLCALRGSGLPTEEMFAALSAIVTYVEAAAREEAEYAHAERETGQSWQAWWAERQHVFEEHFDVAEFPTMTQVWVDGDFQNADDTEAVGSYEYGLQRLLDGIEASVPHPT